MVLFGIRELAYQFIGPPLDIEVENSDSKKQILRSTQEDVMKRVQEHVGGRKNNN